MRIYLLKWIEAVIGTEGLTKLREYIKGLYRYPRNMIGRNLPPNLKGRTDIIVFAAHPDDEVLGLCATLSRHKEKNKKVTVVYVTDGTARSGASWKRKKELSLQIANTRYKEGIQALSLINISFHDVFCLGFPDSGTHRYLKEITKDVFSIIEILKPKKVYVHCIEGGHNDHDLVSLIVKSVCNQFGITNIYEWAEYSPLYPLGTEEMRFLPSLSHHTAEEIKIELSEKELILKKEMLTCHKSQDVADLFTQGEMIREAGVTHIKEEIAAYSQIPKEDWSYLIDRFLQFMERRSSDAKLLKTNSPKKQAISRT